MGKKATLYNTGGEGSPRWQIVEEVGNHEQDEDIDKKRKSQNILLPGDNELPPTRIGDEDLSHMTNWLSVCVAASSRMLRCRTASRIPWLA